MLNIDQFTIMTTIDKSNGEKVLLGQLKKQLFPFENIENAIGDLLNKEFLAMDSEECLFITDNGYKELKPYRVERAVIMAAGLGSRLMPITINTPKPLVKVNGKKIIETLLDALLAADIREIYIVRGYLKENFEQLLYKYPMIKFVDNPMYSRANSISSIYFARNYLNNAYVMEADLYLSNPDLISKYQYQSNGVGIKVDKTDDWYFTTVNGKITKLIQDIKDRPADENIEIYQEVGLSYLTEEDGKKLSNHLDIEFNKNGGTELYWDQVQYSIHIDDYDFRIRECNKDDIVEIDSFKELVAIDDTYSIVI